MIPRQRLTAPIVGTAVVLLVGALLFGGSPPPPPSTGIGGAFSLVAPDGRTITNRSFPGRLTIIYFGFTSCADICPTTLASVVTALDQLGPKADRVQPLFITLDPTRDTAPILRRYTASFSPRLIGLTGAG